MKEDVCSEDQEPRLQLDAIKGPEAEAYWRQVQAEEYNGYEAWLRDHANASGTKLRVSEEERRAEHDAMRERIYMRFGYRFIHMLPLVQQRLLRETYPDPPAEYLVRPEGAAPEQRAV